MVDVRTAKKQIQEARQQVEQKRQEAKQVSQRLQEAEKSLPETQSKRALRKMSGLSGRQQRRQVETARQQLAQKQELVSGYKKQLSQYETEKIQPVEKQIRNIEREQRAYEKARELFLSQDPAAVFVDDDLVKKYYKKFSVSESQAKQSFLKDVETLQKSLPEGEKLRVDLKNMRVLGVESKLAQQSISLEQYNKAIQDINKQFKDLPEVKNVLLSQSKLSLNDRDLGSIQKLSAITGSTIQGDLFPLVTARKQKVEIKEKPKTFFGRLKDTFFGERKAPTQSYVSAYGTQGAFISQPSGILTGGTAIGRTPTQEELKNLERFRGAEKFNKVSYKDVLSGKVKARDYAQMKLFDFGESVSSFITDEKFSKAPQDLKTSLSYSELFKKGELPAIVRKGAYDLGFFTERYVARPVKKTIPTLTPLTKEQEKRVGKDIGSLYLFGAFSPLMSTGTSQYADEVVEINYKGQKVRVLKSEVKAYKLLEEFDDAFKSGGKPAVLRKLNRLVEESGGNLVGVENLLRQLKAKGFIEDYAVNTLTGQFGFLKSPSIPRTAKPVTIEIDVSALRNVGNLKYVDVVGASTRQAGKDFFPSVKKETLKQEQEFDVLGLKSESKQETKTIPILKSLSKTKQKQVTKQRQQVGQISALGTLLQLKSLLKTKQVTKQKTKQKQVTKQKILQKTKTTTKPTPILLPVSKQKTKPKPRDVLEGMYKIFTRKKGVDVEVGEAPTEQEAFELLGEKLKTTLRASGFVEKGGKKIKPLIFGLGFRPSKTDSFRVVQRKERRLSTKPETKEIQFFRKKTGRKLFKFI